MAIRKRIAERLASVRGEGRAVEKTPILDEIPRSAERIESFELPFPEVRGIIPAIAKGKAHGPTAGMWYRVTFPKLIYEASVVCVALARTGAIPKPKSLEEIAELDVLEKIEELAKLLNEAILPKHCYCHECGNIHTNPSKICREFACPACGYYRMYLFPKVELQVLTIDDFKRGMGDWGVFNPIRDLFAASQYWTWMTLGRGRLVEKINDVLDKLTNRVEDIFSKLHASINAKLGDIDAHVETLRTNINTRLGDIDDRVETLRTRANTALAAIFPSLYTAWGLRRDMAPTILNIRNVTDTGFEFLSLGDTECHWIAVGSRR